MWRAPLPRKPRSRKGTVLKRAPQASIRAFLCFPALGLAFELEVVCRGQTARQHPLQLEPARENHVLYCYLHPRGEQTFIYGGQQTLMEVTDPFIELCASVGLSDAEGEQRSQALMPAPPLQLENIVSCLSILGDPVFQHRTLKSSGSPKPPTVASFRVRGSSPLRVQLQADWHGYGISRRFFQLSKVIRLRWGGGRLQYTA